MRPSEWLGRVADLLDEHGAETGHCLRPPRAYVCTRGPGHTGECFEVPNPRRKQLEGDQA